MDLILESEIVKAEESLRLAMISSDVETLNQLLSKDLMFTNHMGLLLSKDDDLAAHRKGDFKIISLLLSDQVIKCSGEVVVVSSHAKIVGSYKGEAANGNFRFTRVWEKFESKWQVVAGHSSVVSVTSDC